ncbi:MAG: pyridoxamine 5'-phosphate oxidase family protein [Bacteroidales bacterium]|jgi:general stress protein 26|nr:pyridoxamine 5'-phosphate oxidase family protein [Bacteroidales bacterium]
MNQKIIERAEELLRSKSNYVGKDNLAGMEGFVTLALIDENGYPSQSSITISKTDGIKSVTFLTDINSNKVKKIRKCNKASISLASPEYMIILKGTIEILTDLESKRANWQQVLQEAYNADLPMKIGVF